MAIPKYIEEMLRGATYNYDARGENAAAGYTIDIPKRTTRQLVPTFEADIKRLQRWVEREGGEMHILRVPKVTRYSRQSATVTIFDPVMQKVEHLIRRD